MSDLQQVIDAREIDIRCWQCGWCEGRSMSWLSTQRHMSCPTCESLIVLDTSELRGKIMRQRKQLSVLHGQVKTFLKSTPSPQPVFRQATPRPVLDLALAHRTTRRTRGTAR